MLQGIAIQCLLFPQHVQPFKRIFAIQPNDKQGRFIPIHSCRKIGMLWIIANEQATNQNVFPQGIKYQTQ